MATTTEYSKLRKRALERAKRLTAAGIPIKLPNLPKVAEIESPSDLRNAYKRASRFVSNPKTTVRGAKAAQAARDQIGDNLRYMAQDAEKVRKEAERRARKAKASREYRARIKALNAKEKNLLRLAKRWGLKNINTRNVKDFAAYIETRIAQRGLSFRYEELAEVAVDYDALMEIRTNSDAIMADFEAYRQETLNEVERITGIMQSEDLKQYSADAMDQAFRKMVLDQRAEIDRALQQKEHKRRR